MDLKKISFIISASLLASTAVFAQKWQPGYFTDSRGMKEVGFVRAAPGGSGPIKNEGYIEFREDEKAPPTVLSTSDLQSFVAGQDSFVVAHAPGNEVWAKKEYDFVRVVINEDVKIYATRGADGGGGRKRVSVSPAVGMSMGSGGYGTGLGGGIGINIGGGSGGKSSKTSYYYGSNTATMKHITADNFIDVMSDVMGNEPEVVERIRGNQYHIGNIEKLVAYFNKVKAANSK